MLDAYVQGCEPRAICLAEIARGHLPPGVLGKPVVDRLFPQVKRIADQAEALVGSGPATSLDVRLELPDGRALTGTVGGVRGDAVQLTTFSKVAPKHRLAAWVRVLALSAARPERPWTAVTVGRGPDDAITVARIGPLGDTPESRRDTALARLATLVDLHDRGMREPVPLIARTSAAYARARTTAATPSGAPARRGRASASRARTPTPNTSWPSAPVALRRAERRGPARRRAGARLAPVGALALRPLRDAPLGRAPRRRGVPRPVSTTVERPPFDVCGPLPSGVTVLEASAGTGKTFTIAGLTARYVAAGVAPEQLLVMTFSRGATAELRDRVRERLVSAEQGLDRVLAGEPIDPGDGVLAVLATGDPDEVGTRRRRLARAVADFDAATIVTTHGFCQEVLGGLGIAGDLEPGFEFVEDLSDLTEQVVDDLYVRAFHETEDVLFPREQALKIAREAVRNPDAPLEPPADDTLPGRRRKLADAVRRQLDQRKRRLGVMTFDDLLTRLDGALDGEGGDRIVQQLRERYRVVLIDEFQDTDPTQWRIVERAFGDGTTTLVLIGDPKQAIYAFRGADVYAYLDAKRAAGRHETLDVNWRSDQPLLDAYDALFRDAHLGHPGIVYRRVRAADDNLTTRLDGAPEPAALRVRIVDRRQVGIYNGMARVDPAREAIAEDLAADVVRLLNAGARIEGRRVEPGHLAVLVRRNVDADLVQGALADVDVPGVLAGAGSVFETPAARDWLRLLEALERPSSVSRAHAVALTTFVGWPAERVAQVSDAQWEDLHATLHRWAGVLRDRGVAALLQRVTLTHEIPGRVLAFADGERTLTDLRHVGELLHAAGMQQRLGTSALTGWLRRRMKDAGRGLAEEVRSRRLESDADAVQILTVHRSKGLEFPIVYAPFLWDPSWVPRRPEPVTFHDPGDRDARKVDVALEGTDYQDHRRQSLAEQRGDARPSARRTRGRGTCGRPG